MSTLRHHYIKFKESPQGSPEDWQELIKKINGVINVRIDMAKRSIYVEYNLLQCCEEAIEKWMEKIGFVLDDSLFQRIKRGWIHYTEENERDAMSYKPHSCCDIEDPDKDKKY